MKIFLLSLITTSYSLILNTNKLWKFNNIQYFRPEWAKEVSIHYDDITRHIYSIEGIIIPINTTNRPNYNPEPYNNCQTGIINNNDKGHIWALSNGGPNINLNIILQNNNWQRYGNWRNLEKEIYHFVKEEYKWENSINLDNLLKVSEPKNKVYWKINLIYQEEECNDEECYCQPLKYNGIIKSKNKKYKFEILNNGSCSNTQCLEEYNDDNDDEYFFIYIIILIIIIISCMLFYKRNETLTNEIENIELNLI